MGGRDQHRITAGAMLQTLRASVHQPVLLGGGGEGDAADGSFAGSLDDGEDYTQSETDIESQSSSSRIKPVTCPTCSRFTCYFRRLRVCCRASRSAGVGRSMLLCAGSCPLLCQPLPPKLQK
jgi:hypothetical protein